jgi:hypothetical protein
LDDESVSTLQHTLLKGLPITFKHLLQANENISLIRDLIQYALKLEDNVDLQFSKLTAIAAAVHPPQVNKQQINTQPRICCDHCKKKGHTIEVCYLPLLGRTLEEHKLLTQKARQAISEVPGPVSSLIGSTSLVDYPDLVFNLDTPQAKFCSENIDTCRLAHSSTGIIPLCFDFRATQHMVSSSEFLLNVTHHETAIVLADPSKQLMCTEKGDFPIEFLGNNGNSIIIKNVLVVPKIDPPLIIIAFLADQGIES